MRVTGHIAGRAVAPYTMGYSKQQRLARWIRFLIGLSAFLLMLAGLLWLAPALASDFHIVQPGENLERIAREYAVNLEDLRAYNGIVNPNHIVVGQELALPPKDAIARSAVPAAAGSLPGDGGYHSVQTGESLSKVARLYGLTTGDLMRLNGLTNPNRIAVGQKLRVTARVQPIRQESRTEDELQKTATIYRVKEGDTLQSIARAHNTTMEAIMVANGLPAPQSIWVGRSLRVPPSAPTTLDAQVAGAPANGVRRIEIDLSDQTLTAWQGDVAVMHTIVSTGKASTPTVIGRFSVGLKVDKQRMFGEDYDLPDVPWVMYFFEDYAIHGAYWHTLFGVPVSHGCINVRPEEAKALYEWAAVGTEVWVHE